MIDLCLIVPPQPWLVQPHAQAPLGILYVAAAAERAGYEVRVRNLAGDSLDPTTWRWPEARVYGVTGTCLDIEATNAIAREVTQRDPEARVIVGGPISLSADELDRSAIETVVHGEGEVSIVDLLGVLGGPPDVHGQPVDVNKMPYPARHLWSGPFGGGVFIGGREYFGGGSATLLTTRGCPFACAFCAGPALASRKVRFRDPASVVVEMEELVHDYGVRQFRLSDEFFTCKRSHVEGVCSGIRASDILGHGRGIAWRASVGVNPHDPELWETMRSAGCREVALGVETADPAVLALLTNKGKVEDAYEAIRNARGAGLGTRALMMAGLPGETPESLRHNLRFLAEAGADAFACTIFTPLPGSAIYREPGRFGCRPIPERRHRSVCLFGPDGRRQIEPTIEVETMSLDEHARLVEMFVHAVQATGRVGKG